MLLYNVVVVVVVVVVVGGVGVGVVWHWVGFSVVLQREFFGMLITMKLFYCIAQSSSDLTLLCSITLILEPPSADVEEVVILVVFISCIFSRFVLFVFADKETEESTGFNVVLLDLFYSSSNEYCISSIVGH